MLRAEHVRQRDLALALGISEKHMSQMLTGRVGGSIEWLEQIAAQLGRRWVLAPVELELAGLREAAEILGVTPPRVTQLRQRADFPPPVAVLRMGSVWLRADIEAYHARRRLAGRV